MPPKISEFLAKAKTLWTGRTLTQQMLIGGLAALLTAVFVVGIIYLNRPDYRVLYSKLSNEDASKIVTMLKAAKEPYQLADNGQTVLVRSDRVYELRLKVASEGNLHGQGIGFEIFDEVKIGQTDFVQHINYQRALQGELARTIMEFPKVESARVHLVVPKKSLFIEEQTAPSAAVVIKMKEKDGKLDPKEVQGIVNLVTMAVEGLDKKRITVTDQNGQPLYQPADEDSAGMNTTQLEFKAQMERKIERRIEELLAPIVGPQKIIARVNTDLDFSHKTIKKELFNPDSQVVRSETRSEETVNGKAALDGAAPDANFRGDGFQGTQSSQDSSRETRTTNYEINKEEQQIVSPVGELKRLGVAVIVDGTYTKDAKTGQMTYVPRTAEEIARIKSLVQSAVGFDKDRGDSIEVSSIAFGAEDISEGPSLVKNFLDLSGKIGKPLLTGLLIFLFLILVIRPVVMALIRPKVAEQEVEEVASLPSTEERLAIEETVEVPEEALDTARRLELLKGQAMQLTEQNMDQAIRLLKSWAKQEA
ncbi:MAG: flagellar M-ring protein FliF [Desulfovibrionaceae bacterium CG1_02_65_16]|nr:MAG: flagellar M-ring protein FliF [Desulfovibrionaceae bacterium CG1_02_65_16]